ncbi:MAG TPA: heme ABC exporter ATP-binding protein CcmA [Thermodesulfobacteriota bacterium]|nr:heme ABC exporter ATP-binding protein CcmA [Thermodesulfobacteriota bacterium]
MKDPSQPIISASNLEKSYGVLNALRGLSFEVNSGEFIVIFGPNGAGKSTLLKILSTILKPTSGTVLIGDNDVIKGPDKVRNLIGLVSHESYLYDNLSALENLKFFGDLYGLESSEERAKELLQTMQLDNRGQDLIGNYSRGMKQRVSLARALIHDPDILLLDEPFNGLDILGISIVNQILKTLKAEGKTILMSTHNFDECIGIADIILVIVRGEIKYQNTQALNKEQFLEIYSGLVDTN